MLTLNQISPALKKEVKLRKINIVIRLYGLTAIAIVVLAAFYLFAGAGLLYYKNQQAAEGIAAISDSAETYGEKVGDLNEQLKQIESIQSEYVPYSLVLEKIVKISGENIAFTNISLNGSDKTIVFKGRADTRDNLLAFKKALEEIEYFKDVDLPLTDILKKENIVFTINSRLNYPL